MGAMPRDQTPEVWHSPWAGMVEANVLVIEDLGRVAFHIGAVGIVGPRCRRKVLALLCFLLTRPGWVATLDEVTDNLWPTLEPRTVVNSLNQAIYLLRRALDPSFARDSSPEYVRREAGLVWLDREFVRSRSQRCAGLIQALDRNLDPLIASELSSAYFGPFALNFAYEPWAEVYRASLHTSYLQAVERALASAISSGRYDHGIAIAQRALEIAPDADDIEVLLIRLFRLAGSQSAASERYRRYARSLRQVVGIDPPPLAEL